MSGRFTVVPAAYLLLRDDLGRVLLQLRSGTDFMDGYWAAAAAGHVEAGESAQDAAVREAHEELGITVHRDDVVPLTTMHRTQASGLAIDQRVDFFFTTDLWRGEPFTKEPHRAADLAWFALDALPKPVVPHELAVLEAVRWGSVPTMMMFGFGHPTHL